MSFKTTGKCSVMSFVYTKTKIWFGEETNQERIKKLRARFMSFFGSTIEKSALEV